MAAYHKMEMAREHYAQKLCSPGKTSQLIVSAVTRLILKIIKNQYVNKMAQCLLFSMPATLYGHLIGRYKMLISSSCQLQKSKQVDQKDDRMKKALDDNRRKNERVSVDDSLYVVIDTDPQTMGQVVEISSTGMAFTFVDIDDASLRLSRQSVLHMDLFVGGRGIYLKNLACKLISKIENAPGPSFSSLSIKRVGVHFEDLSLPQQVQINHLVRRQHLKDN